MKTIEKIIQSATPPTRQDVVWIDISNPRDPQVKLYINGQWKLASSESEEVAELEERVNNIVNSIGEANGIASLDGAGLVPSSQLPSYVDDILEYADFASLPTTGETGKIYVTLDNGNQYRWSGSMYVPLNNDKADKVTNAVSGNFAGLDSNGNLTDSGSKASDFATASDFGTLSNKVNVIDEVTATALNDINDRVNTAEEELDNKMQKYDTSILDEGEDQYAYGVLIDFTQGKSSYDLTRIGNMDLHRELPVQSQYKGCIWDLENQEIVTYLNPQDWSLATEDKTAEEIDELLHDGTKSIRVETPKFYATSKVLATDGAGNTTMAKVMFSTRKLNPLYVEIPKMVTDFRECRLSENGWPSSSLDVNDYLYGGYHTTKNAILTGKLNLLHPSTNIDRETMREYCGTVNTHIFSYEAYKWIFYWAVVIEYATLFTAKPMIQELDENGFHQGGLGPGMTSIESRGAKYSDDSYIYNEDYDIQDSIYLEANYFQSDASDEFPLRDIGVTNNWGNRTGENIVEYTRNGKTSHVHQNRYRGFEFPFGDIMLNLDGFVGNTIMDDNDNPIAEAYFACSNPEQFDDVMPSDYEVDFSNNGWRLALFNNKLDSFHREGYDEGSAKYLCIGDNGDLFATKWFVDENYKYTYYFCNYNYPIDGGGPTTLLVGSVANYGGVHIVGLGYFVASGVGSADNYLGFRCFNIIQD